MKKITTLLCVSTLLAAGCRKDSTTNPQLPPDQDSIAAPTDPKWLGTAVAHPDKIGMTIAEAESPFHTYIIPTGGHYCVGNEYAVDTFRGLRFQAIFDSSCIYTTADPANQADINKLLGFSDSATHHHRNSARFGWAWHGSALRIYAYCYSNGLRQTRELGTVALGKAHDFSIELRAGQYFFSLDGKHHTLMERSAQEAYAYGYKLLPYFGGDEVAPHEVRIKIRETPGP